jgi:O-antigen ligase
MEKKFNLVQVSTYSFALLLFFLPLWRWVENILLGLLVLIFIITRKKTINISNLLKTSTILFVLYVFLRSTIDYKFVSVFSETLTLIPLLFIPIAFTIITKQQLNKGLLFLFLGILTMQIIASIGIVDYYLFTEAKKIRLSNSAIINEILKFERPYLGFFSAINVILAYYLYMLKKQWIYLLPISISLVLVIVISARLSFIIIFLILFILVLNQLKNKVKILIPLIVMILLTILYLSLQKNSLIQRFYAIKRDSRNIIWKGGMEQINSTKNYIFGNGSQNEIRDNLLNYYKYKAKFNYAPEKKRFIRENYNIHNQFLNEFIRGGFLGVVLLIAPLFIIFYKNLTHFNIISILLLFAIFSFCLVENILERQKGVYLLAIILATTNKFYEKK